MPITFNCQIKGCIEFLAINNRVAKLSKSLRKIEKTREAIVILNEANKILPGNIKVLTELGVCNLRIKEFITAREWLYKALEIVPEDTVAHNTIGQTFLAEGNSSAAREWFLTTLKIDPKNTVAHNSIGQTYLAAGNNIAARKWFLKTLKIDPEDEVAKILLARVFF